MLLNISFHFDFIPLLVVVAVAWLAPILLSLLKVKNVPSVIVEIIMGYIIGVYFFVSRTGSDFHILEFLATAGFIFIMFLSGLEIDVDQIISSFPKKKTARSVFKNAFILGLAYFALVVILSYLSTFFLSRFIVIPHRWYFALIMVTTSVGIVLPVLKGRGELSSSYGQMIIIAAAVADVLSIILFTFTAFILRNGFKFELLYILIVFFAFYIFYRITGWLRHVMLFKRLFYQLSHAASQIRVRSSILIMLIFVGISQYIGEEVILLGAFLSGLLLSTLLHKERSVLMIKLDGMGYGFFIPIFFIMVGIMFEPSALKDFDSSILIFLVMLLLVMFTIKIIPSFLWIKMFGPRKAIAGGFLMSSQLSLIIAASVIGLQLGVVTPAINASFILMAVLTCLIAPVLFNWIYPVDITEGEKTIIIGGSSTAVLLARRMDIHGKKVIIVEKDNKRFQEIKEKGLVVFEGDGLDEEIYRKIKLLKDNFVVVETGDDEQNLKIASILKGDFSHDKIITRSDKMSFAEKFTQLGVKSIDRHRIFATAIENFILRPTTYNDLVETFENYTVEEIFITNSQIDGMQVKDVPFPDGALLILIKREKSFFIPHGETYFKLGDILHVLGTPTALENVISRVQAR
ncbi:MAG: cation:proton antiporter [Bacteroidales bacterium]|nr:cation:proton antiporter [Bacteroidales bacterium]